MTMDRLVRGVTALLIAFVLIATLVPARAVVAQESTPASSSLLEGLGLPELEISVSDSGVVAPESIEAGAVLVKVINTGEAPVTFALVDAPDDITAEIISADLLAPVLGEFWLESKAPLVHDVMPGSTVTVAVLLEPGSWTIAGTTGSMEEGEGAPITGAELMVTGELAADAADAIAAAATLEFGEYTFAFNGEIPAAPAILKVTNTHTVPHHAVIFGAERVYNDEEALAGLMSLMSGASPTADFMISDFPLFVTPGVAGGGTVWIEVSFEPGAYLALCFISDPDEETPHVMMGMIKSFEVAG
jgi:hypothetical protein